jgi:hypothetical protein
MFPLLSITQPPSTPIGPAAFISTAMKKVAASTVGNAKQKSLAQLTKLASTAFRSDLVFMDYWLRC